jgi:hypothetical protein
MNKKKFNLLMILFLAAGFIFPAGPASAQDLTPHVVATTLPVTPPVRAAADTWLAENAPEPLPYYAITYVGFKGAEIYICLVALTINDPNAEWHITDPDTVGWMGTIVIREDGSINQYTPTLNTQSRSAAKQAAMYNGPGGGSQITFPWANGSAMIFGPRGVHDAAPGLYWADGMSAVDFGSGDDMGSGMAKPEIYAAYLGEIDHVCQDATTTMIRTVSAISGDYLIYGHLLQNSQLEVGHIFNKGAYIGSLKYGTFDDDCGWATQADKHYHLHFGFTPANNSYRIENCILNVSQVLWTCGTQVVKTGMPLISHSGINSLGEDVGMFISQPNFWDYMLVGFVEIWDRGIVNYLPTHTAIQYTYVLYNSAKLAIRIVRVMLYSNINLYWFWSIFVLGIKIRLLFGGVEVAAFLFKAWKSLVPIFGA